MKCIYTLLLLCFHNIAISAITVAGLGDSIMAGHCGGIGFTTAVENAWVESGDTNYSPMHMLTSISGFSTITTNLGYGSATWSLINSTYKQYIPVGTRWVVAHCGVNDIAGSVSWNDAVTNINSIKAYCDSLGARFMIDDIFPWPGSSDATSLIIRTWNTNYHNWAATNGAYPLVTHDLMGKLRISTGEYDELNTDYDCVPGNIHLNPTGVLVWTTNIWNKIQSNSTNVVIKNGRATNFRISP